MNIKLLSKDTISKIAAGEIITSPSAVVKELVENSLDANSNFIKIEVDGGGLLRIKIDDNGMGIFYDDLPLAFKRFATSKISSLEDLYSFTTMGFRGEALAAISSISKVLVSTCSASIGRELYLEGGTLVKDSHYSRGRGTSIEVASLFYNLPARKKFQRKPAYNNMEINRLVSALSLSRPDVGFELICDKKKRLSYRASNEITRVEEVLGKEFSQDLCEIKHHVGRSSFGGFLSRPPKGRRNKSGQFIFINQRLLSSDFISKIVKDITGTRLSGELYPEFVFWIELPGKYIDVNVHPKKEEVNFLDKVSLKNLLEEGIIKSMGIKPPSFLPLKYENFSDKIDLQNCHNESENETKEILDFFAIEVFGFIGLYHLVKITRDIPEFFLVNVKEIDNILKESDFLKATREKKVEIERFIFPETIDLPLRESGILLDNIDLLKDIGIDIRSFGRGSFTLDGISPYFEGCNKREILLEFTKMLEAGDDISSLVKRLFRTRCLAYSFDEVISIVRRFDSSGLPRGKSMLLLNEESVKLLVERL